MNNNVLRSYLDIFDANVKRASKKTRIINHDTDIVSYCECDNNYFTLNSFYGEGYSRIVHKKDENEELLLISYTNSDGSKVYNHNYNITEGIVISDNIKYKLNTALVEFAMQQLMMGSNDARGKVFKHVRSRIINDSYKFEEIKKYNR